MFPECLKERGLNEPERGLNIPNTLKCSRKLTFDVSGLLDHSKLASVERAEGGEWLNVD